jgi:hypothetical protein
MSPSSDLDEIDEPTGIMNQLPETKFIQKKIIPEVPLTRKLSDILSQQVHS